VAMCVHKRYIVYWNYLLELVINVSIMRAKCGASIKQRTNSNKQYIYIVWSHVWFPPHVAMCVHKRYIVYWNYLLELVINVSIMRAKCGATYGFRHMWPCACARAY